MFHANRSRPGPGSSAPLGNPLHNSPVGIRLHVHLNLPAPCPQTWTARAPPFLQQTIYQPPWPVWPIQPTGTPWAFHSLPQFTAYPFKSSYSFPFVVDPSAYFTRPDCSSFTGLSSPPRPSEAHPRLEARSTRDLSHSATDGQPPDYSASPSPRSPSLHSSLNSLEGPLEAALPLDRDPPQLSDPARLSIPAPEPQTGSKDLTALKDLLSEYFFGKKSPVAEVPLSPIHLDIAKVFLIKKLVHDKKKSRIFHAIAELTPESLPLFLAQHPAINRKNIIKSNMFKRVWQALEEARPRDFHEYYFSALSARHPRESFSLKAYRKSHSFNLADEFYLRCFSSKRFKKDFFACLRRGEVQRKALVQSRERFGSFFESWVLEVRAFVEGRRNPFERSFKLPDFKFGLSARDLELTEALFERVLSK